LTGKVLAAWWAFSALVVRSAFWMVCRPLALSAILRIDTVGPYPASVTPV
jgi:hypothetical protein